ncbi:hypothetical protein HY623_03210 [Candidatus Uhrbacteria bacterium]|nr:hypothetical protein [Candidatus Uhrbacteria bacterium]
MSRSVLLKSIVVFLFVGGVSFFANIFLANFLSKESAIYYWDWSTFEVQYSLVTQGMKHDPVQTLATIYTSLIFHQYSFLIALFLAPWGFLFGTDRAAYLFGVLNVFGLPALLVICAVFWKFITRIDKPTAPIFFIPLVVGILDPHFWKPILQGYYDVAVVLVMGAVWLCVLAQQKNRKTFFSVTAGVFLALLALMRRWTPFWSVAFFAALGVDWLICRALKKEPVWSMRSILYCGVAALLSFFLIAPTVFIHMGTTPYATLYSAYALGRTHLQLMGDAMISYGLFGVGLALYGCSVALRDNRVRSYAFVFIVQTLLTLFFFTGVQRLDPHHHYPIVLAVIFFESVALWSLLRKGIASPLRLALAAMVFILAALNFSQAFIPPVRAQISQSIFFSNVWHDPLVRHDIPALKALITFVEETTPRNSPIYVLASSGILNDDIIKYSCRYARLQTSLCDRLLPTNHVDRRDGFPKHFFNAEAVITTSPTQYHLLSRDQKVIGALAQALHEKRAVGRAYKKADTVFRLDDGVTAEVYYKIRDPLPEELSDLDEMFEKNPLWDAPSIFFQGAR